MPSVNNGTVRPVNASRPPNGCNATSTIRKPATTTLATRDGSPLKPDSVAAGAVGVASVVGSAAAATPDGDSSSRRPNAARVHSAGAVAGGSGGGLAGDGDNVASPTAEFVSAVRVVSRGATLSGE